MAGVAANELPSYLDEFMWRQRHPDRAHHMDRILEAIAQMDPTPWEAPGKEILLKSEKEEEHPVGPRTTVLIIVRNYHE